MKALKSSLYCFQILVVIISDFWSFFQSKTKMKLVRMAFLMVFCLPPHFASSQSMGFWVEVRDEDNSPLIGAVVTVEKNHKLTDTLGRANFIANAGEIKITVSMIGHFKTEKKVNLNSDGQLFLFKLKALDNTIDEVVITDNMQESYLSNSVTTVEVYNEKFFKRNATPNLFQALQMVNGVQPQLLCNVCNTGVCLR